MLPTNFYCSKASFFLVKPKVRFGSWLCENTSTLKGDRRSYSFKTVLAYPSELGRGQGLTDSTA